MHGVRLVSTPARNNRGTATRGRPESVLAMFEKSIAVGKGIGRPDDTERTTPQIAVTPQPARFLRRFGLASNTHTETLRENQMGRTHVVGLALVLVPILTACHEDNTLGLGNSSGDRFTAALTGANVRPVPVATTATASASLTFLEPGIGQTQRSLGFTLTATNLTSATAAHVHLGGAAVSNGPILITLYTNPADTALTGTQLVSRTMTEGSLGAVGLDSLATLVSRGAAYVDIHATGYPNGLIRGQLVRNGQQVASDLFAATGLSGANERPTPVTSTASGVATFELLPNSTMRFNVTVSALVGATMAHIHTGVVDSAGPIAVTLFNSTTPLAQLNGTLTSGTFSGTNIQLPGVSFDSLLSLMRTGRTYVNVHTEKNPNGEIRAQIVPVSVLP